MTDSRIAHFTAYSDAWAPVSDTERRTLLNESVTEDITYRDFFTGSPGLAGIDALVAHIEKFQKMGPGARFRQLEIIGWGNDVLAKWQRIGGDGKLSVTGYDAIVFAPDGRIASIVGYAEMDEQRIG
jgi:hypothetical protein